MCTTYILLILLVNFRNVFPSNFTALLSSILSTSVGEKVVKLKMEDYSIHVSSKK